MYSRLPSPIGWMTRMWFRQSKCCNKKRKKHVNIVAKQRDRHTYMYTNTHTHKCRTRRTPRTCRKWDIKEPFDKTSDATFWSLSERIAHLIEYPVKLDAKDGIVCKQKSHTGHQSYRKTREGKYKLLAWPSETQCRWKDVFIDVRCVYLVSSLDRECVFCIAIRTL